MNLNSKEVAEYLTNLFRQVYPDFRFYNTDNIGWEVWRDGPLSCEAYYNATGKWIIFGGAVVNFTYEEEIIKQIKEANLRAKNKVPDHTINVYEGIQWRPI